jgi:hypothetical protein
VDLKADKLYTAIRFKVDKKEALREITGHFAGTIFKVPAENEPSTSCPYVRAR